MAPQSAESVLQSGALVFMEWIPLTPTLSPVPGERVPKAVAVLPLPPGEGRGEGMGLPSSVRSALLEKLDETPHTLRHAEVLRIVLSTSSPHSLALVGWHSVHRYDGVSQSLWIIQGDG